MMLHDDRGVYVHLPFCPYICPYCDFAKRPWKQSEANAYLLALRAEIQRCEPLSAATVFLGGGTPNTYPALVIRELLDTLRARFALAPDAEISMELNPDPKLCRELPALRAAGVTRLSIGAQSFVPAELRTLGRRHTPGDVAAAVHVARAAGFENISIDLIFGTPGQTVGSWRSTLDRALELSPDHLSTYGLTVEEETPFWDWQQREPAAFSSSDTEADLYALAIERLGSEGFEHYEISNFARPGRRCRHNENYWRNGEYVGFGVGAASYLDGIRRAHTRDVARYQAAAMARLPIPGQEERLGRAAQLGEAAMLALRTSDGVNLPDFSSRYAVDFLKHFDPVVADMHAAGMLDVGDRRVALTPRGRFLANDVCEAFVTFGR